MFSPFGSLNNVSLYWLNFKRIAQAVSYNLFTFVHLFGAKTRVRYIIKLQLFNCHLHNLKLPEANNAIKAFIIDVWPSGGSVWMLHHVACSAMNLGQNWETTTATTRRAESGIITNFISNDGIREIM